MHCVINGYEFTKLPTGELGHCIGMMLPVYVEGKEYSLALNLHDALNRGLIASVDNGRCIWPLFLTVSGGNQESSF